MAGSAQYTAVLDANVRYPALLRDVLLSLADADLYSAKWSVHIRDEWTRSLLRDRPEMGVQIAAAAQAMEDAIPDCLVSGYEHLIEGLKLPDPDDRHVLAAALRCSAQVIVTSNLSDFPASALEPFNIEAQSPDQFVLDLVELAPGRVASVVQEQSAALRNPERTVEDLLESLSDNGLPRAVAAFRASFDG